MVRVWIEKRISGFTGKITWYFRWKDPVSGKERKKATTAKTKRERDVLARQLERLIENEEYGFIEKRPVRIYEILEDRLQYNKIHNRSWKRDVGSMKWLKVFFRNIVCNSITSEKINNFVAARLDAEGVFNNHRCVQPSTVNRELAYLRSAFYYAIENGKLKRAPKIKTLPELNKGDRVLTEHEYERLLFASATHLRSLVIIAWETGMRRGEILKLRWDQVDLSRDIITLYQSDTKNKSIRVVPISRRLKKIFEGMDRVSDYVITFRGNPVKDPKEAFWGACRRAGIKDFRFHDLRHCFITRKRREGYADRCIMAITGHKSQEAYKRYDTVSEDDLKEVVGAASMQPQRNKYVTSNERNADSEFGAKP